MTTPSSAQPSDGPQMSGEAESAKQRAGVKAAGWADHIAQDPVAAIQLTLGLMDVVTCLCATLIGRSVVAPDAFQDDLRKRVAWWRGEGNDTRATPPQLVLERLKMLEGEQREAIAHQIRLDNIPNGRTN
jgi:hypothetical protein